MGHWVTINGSPVYIESGETPSEAIERRKAVKAIPHTTAQPKEFADRLKAAKATIDPDKAWRVDDTHSVEDYKQDKLFSVGNGSCVAVTPDGDIISVCRAYEDVVRGSQLLQLARANGGCKLDAFGKDLYRFYTKNGFEPTSWTRFDRDYAPHDWVAGRDNEEPVIFYRYTGNVTSESYESFIMRVAPSADYDTACETRNNAIGKR